MNNNLYTTRVVQLEDQLRDAQVQLERAELRAQSFEDSSVLGLVESAAMSVKRAIQRLQQWKEVSKNG